MQRITLTTAQLEALQERLRALLECRHPRGQRHCLATVLTIAIAAVLAGARGYSAIAEWAARLTQAQLKRLRARYNPRTERFEATATLDCRGFRPVGLNPYNTTVRPERGSSRRTADSSGEWRNRTAKWEQ